MSQCVFNLLPFAEASSSASFAGCFNRLSHACTCSLVRLASLQIEPMRQTVLCDLVAAPRGSFGALDPRNERQSP
jgi:hypothetical protein